MTINKNLLRLYKAERDCGGDGETNRARGALMKARRRLAKGDRVYCALWPWQAGRGNVSLQPRKSLDSSRYVWIENPESAGLRRVGFADENLPRYSRAIKHQGWFIDDSQDEVFRGVVYQLPGRDGRARYLAGYADPFNPPAAFMCLDIIEGMKHAAHDEAAKRDAATAADEIARIYAERERAYREVADARWRYDAIPGEIASLGAKIDVLRGERIAARRLVGRRKFPTLCVTINAKIAELAHDIWLLKAEREALENDYAASDPWERTS